MSQLNATAEALLLAVKYQVPTQTFVDRLANCNVQTILNLESDNQKIAFWLNIYNAFYQLLAAEKPGLGRRIYSRKSICVAQLKLSLDDIEHGILRRGVHKYSFGFLKHVLAYDALKKFQPSYLDSRIHFALNCGANSCPPITVFKVETIQKQLSNVTEGFLREETTVNESSNLISTTRLFLWYYNDFGKKAGILNILKDVFQLNESRWKIIYKPYDWRKNLGNFK